MKIARIDIPFYYLGARNYVNGLTIFEEMLKAYLGWADQPFSWITEVEIFRINRFVRNACHLEIHPVDPPKRETIVQAAARMRIRLSNSEQVHLILLERDDHPVRQRMDDYDRGQYIDCESEKAGNSAEATLLCHVKDLCTLMRGIVETNYRYCCNQALKLNVASGVSWAYLNNFQCPPIDPSTNFLSVRFSKGSTMTLPEKVFIIRQFHFEKQLPANPAEIGFFFNLPRAG